MCRATQPPRPRGRNTPSSKTERQTRPTRSVSSMVATFHTVYHIPHSRPRVPRLTRPQSSHRSRHQRRFLAAIRRALESASSKTRPLLWIRFVIRTQDQTSSPRTGWTPGSHTPAPGEWGRRNGPRQRCRTAPAWVESSVQLPTRTGSRRERSSLRAGCGNVASAARPSCSGLCCRYTCVRACLVSPTSAATAASPSITRTSCARMPSCTLGRNRSSAAIARARLPEQRRWTTTCGRTLVRDRSRVKNAARLFPKPPSSADTKSASLSVRRRTDCQSVFRSRSHAPRLGTNVAGQSWCWLHVGKR